ASIHPRVGELVGRHDCRNPDQEYCAPAGKVQLWAVANHHRSAGSDLSQVSPRLFHKAASVFRWMGSAQFRCREYDRAGSAFSEVDVAYRGDERTRPVDVYGGSFHRVWIAIDLDRTARGNAF